MTLICPHCGKETDGGMPMVRHLMDEHGMDTETANNVVDEMYEGK